MAANVKEVLRWQLGRRDKKDWSIYHWSKEYDSFESLMEAASQFLKENPGVVWKIVTRRAWEAVQE